MYPYDLLKKETEIFPIFWEKNKKIYNLSMDNTWNWFWKLTDEEIKNQKLFQSKINEVFEETKAEIIISEYLENREKMFNVLWCEQMVKQWRFYHLWLDLSVKLWSNIYSPLDWIVYEIWYEEWEWNYGWYIILEHNIYWEKFYSLYGHLNPNKFNIKKWQFIEKWNVMWKIWDFTDNWWYFYHTHLQIITELWKEYWFFSKWYCTKEQLIDIQKYTPDPRFLFRY
jgi:hypothetical protein